MLAGGESWEGNLTTSFGSDNVLYEYPLCDVGADGYAVPIGGSVTPGPTLMFGGRVVSAGSFPGENGTINWSSVSSIKAGDLLYLTTLEFRSSAHFGVSG